MTFLLDCFAKHSCFQPSFPNISKIHRHGIDVASCHLQEGLRVMCQVCWELLVGVRLGSPPPTRSCATVFGRQPPGEMCSLSIMDLEQCHSWFGYSPVKILHCRGTSVVRLASMKGTRPSGKASFKYAK